VSELSKIDWLNGGATWNPLHGCSQASLGCVRCYAVRQVHRLAGNPLIGDRCEGLTRYNAVGDLVWTGRVRLHHELLRLPESWKRGRMVFVPSLGDLFHAEVPSDFVDQVVATMRRCPQHTFVVLTKRPARMAEYTSERGPLPANCWAGTSVCTRADAANIIGLLAVKTEGLRILSVEPMLEAMYLRRLRMSFDCSACGTSRTVNPFTGVQTCGCGERRVHPKLDWVICGAESGPSARPFYEGWARDLLRQCREEHVPFYMKQVSSQGRPVVRDLELFPDDLRVREYPKARPA
jgi:protein gp37